MRDMTPNSINRLNNTNTTNNNTPNLRLRIANNPNSNNAYYGYN